MCELRQNRAGLRRHLLRAARRFAFGSTSSGLHVDGAMLVSKGIAKIEGLVLS